MKRSSLLLIITLIVMMCKSLAWISFRLLIIAGLITWAAGTSAQEMNLALGGGIGYNITPVMLNEDGYDWYQDGWMGNFTPTLEVRYGNKVSGVFKASYIQNSFGERDFNQYGGTSTRLEKDIYHQVHADFLFEHTPSGSRGFFYYLGPGICVPVKVIESVEYWKGAWGMYPAEHTYEEYAVPAECKYYIEGVLGIGGYIPVKENNLISVECNFRFGLYKVPINIYNAEDARMIAIQFILGYLRRL